MGTWSFLGVQSGRGVPLYPQSLLVPLSRKSRAIPLLPLWAVQPVQSFSACTVQLYLYSPYVPNCLYRASLPVQYSYTSTPLMCRTACTDPQCLYSTAIPLLPLCAVLPVQSLSACTVQLYLYSPYVPYCLYRTSVSVQYSYTSTPLMCRTACTEPQCLYSTAIPLLPLLAVRPVHSLSACTVQLYLYSHYGPYGLYRVSVPVQYSYTPTPTMGRTACTELQCLYKGQPLPLPYISYLLCCSFNFFKRYSKWMYQVVWLLKQYEGQTDRQTDIQPSNQSAGSQYALQQATSIKRNGRNLGYILNKPFISQGQLVWLREFDSFVIDDKYRNDTIINK
jgi:hypothetical protein